MTCRDWLLTILDAIDYTKDACRPNEQIGALIPESILKRAREQAEKERP